MNQNNINRLNGLIGVTVFFKNEIHTIKKWKDIAGMICVVTDQRTLQFHYNELEIDFLNRVILQDNTQPAQQIKSAPAFMATPENQNLRSALLEALNKVKTDPGYIAQAKSICDISNSMVQIQKAEIDLIRIQQSM